MTEPLPFSPRILGALLSRNRRLAVGLPLVLAFCTGAISLVLPRWYSASASFRPQSGAGGAARLAGLAAQFGVTVPLDDQGESPDFYAELLRSRAVIVPVVQAPLLDGATEDTLSPDLVAHYGIRTKNRELAVDRAVRRLLSRLEVSTAAKTGIVRLRVKDRDGRSAAAIAQRLLDQVSIFNLKNRQSRSRQERQFIEKRMSDLSAELRGAEDAVTVFLRGNREYRGSPQLSFEYDRLQRQVSTRQQAYGSMMQDFERARIGEVRDTPVITTIDLPFPPLRPDSRQIVLKCILAALVGLAVVVVLLLEFGAELPVPARAEAGWRERIVRFLQWAR